MSWYGFILTKMTYLMAPLLICLFFIANPSIVGEEIRVLVLVNSDDLGTNTISDFLALQVDQTWSLDFFTPLRPDMMAFDSLGLNLLHMRT